MIRITILVLLLILLIASVSWIFDLGKQGASSYVFIAIFDFLVGFLVGNASKNQKK